jgi:RNA polymerase sigma-54 factor
MRTGLHQSTQLRQELKINPRLYQAMDLLYMPLLDLQQHLKQELETNPFLELVEPEEEDEEDAEVEEAPQAEAAGEIDWEQILLEGFDSASPREESEEKDYFEPVARETRDLGDHLREQIALLELSPRELMLAEEIIGNINDDGYLACSVLEVVDAINAEITRAAGVTGLEPEGTPLPLYTLEEGDLMLARMQDLDPPGIGARDLRECLLLQIRQAGHDGSLQYRLVADGFEELINHRWSEVAKRFGIGPAEVQHVADEIAKLNPKPGLAFSGASDGYIIPDLVVEKIDGEYHVFLNDANIPRLKLSRVYQEIARDKKKFEGENKEFISSKLNSANWMIQAIEQRRQTMLKVMHYIVDRQREFFEKGVQGLRPLTLREVAEVIGMHESTVSRVTNEKFVQTPRGVLPLKFFFSSGLSTSGGEDVSARGIKAQIEKLLADENPKRPLTDQAIVNVLREGGVNIARRTVAKYRDQLGVLSARMRKRV